ncbi:MAG: PAS domain S-box protein, partial [Bacteroidota bacterium]
IVPDNLKSEGNYISNETFKGKVCEKESIRKRKDGRLVHVRIQGIPIKSDEQLIGIYGIYEDISGRKLAVDQLRKLSRALEQSASVVIITDTNGVIEYVNPKFTEITGYTFEEVKGKNPRILKSGEKSQEEYKELWETITSGKEWRGEFHNRKKNGELFWESASISPIKNLKGEITNYVAVKEDITEKKKVLDELVKAKHEAEKADRLKSEFLAQISHEIRSPLYVLLSFSEILREKFGDKIDPETADSFNAIETSGKRIIRTVDMVLNMSEIQTGSYEYRPQKIDLLKNVLLVLEKEYRYLAERKKINMKINSSTENAQIVADQYSVTQIFANLIDNAIKYTQRGNIDVSVQRDENEKLIVNVSDTGIGISEHYMSNLFLPFSQEETGYSRSYEGNGLGLALVKKYCEINNAEIFVKSSKGKGTTFSVRFLG